MNSFSVTVYIVALVANFRVASADCIMYSDRDVLTDSGHTGSVDVCTEQRKENTNVPEPLFNDAPLSQVLPEEYTKKFDGTATLGTLREEYGDDAAKWYKAMAEKEIPAEVAEQAAKHVLWRAAVDNFFLWKKVYVLGRLVTWQDLEDLDKDSNDVDNKRCHRITRLLQGDVIHTRGSTDTNPGPDLLTVLEDFMKEHPKWKDTESYILYRDYKNLKNFPNATKIDKDNLAITRVQHSGLCYMHAGAVMQHVVVALNSGGTHHEMLNVAKYIVQFYDAKSVYAHVVDNCGGNSIGFMRDIMGLNKDDLQMTFLGEAKVRSRVSAHAADVASDVREYGIGLVSTFKVERAFQEARTSYDGALTGKPEGQHAMAVVGHRQEGDKHYFLLQNWWINKQFVEVSQDYLASSGASVSFVTKRVSEIPSNYPTVSGAYSLETEDLGDQFQLEMRSV